MPTPVPGLVLRYSYLWYREFLEGREEGQKDRPCAIVASVRADDSGETRVLVLPVTHTPPDHASLAIEIPAQTKRRLGLDDARSWVIFSEWNEFVWPGPDLRRVSNADDASIAFGMLPPGLLAAIRDRFLALARTGGSRRVSRT